jgi:hypothetical protein
MNRERLLQNPLPADRVARRVVFAKGEHWDPIETRNARPFVKTWEAPPEPLQAKPDWAEDYSGLRRGRMVAFRYYGRRDRRGGCHRWIVRCDCGLYELRRINKWVAHENAMDACARCDEAHFVRTGQYLTNKSGDQYTDVEGAGA